MSLSDGLFSGGLLGYLGYGEVHLGQALAFSRNQKKSLFESYVAMYFLIPLGTQPYCGCGFLTFSTAELLVGAIVDLTVR